MESHNTLSFNGKRHLVTGRAELFDRVDARRGKGISVDLTSLFAEDAERVVRHAWIDRRDNLMLTDEIRNGAQPSEVLWKMTTQARPTLVDDRTICLEQAGKRLYLVLDAASEAEAVVLEPYTYKPYELRDEGISRVGFHMQLRAGEQRTLNVHFLTELPQ